MYRIKAAHIATANESIQQILLNKLIGLKEMGYDIHAISSPGKYEKNIMDKGIVFHGIPMKRNISIIHDAVAIRSMTKLLKKERFDIVHTHTAKAGFIGRIAAKFAGVPLVVHTYHGLPFYEGLNPLKYHLYKWLEKIAGRFCNAVLSQNREDMENVRKYGLQHDQKVFYEGNGVNIEELEALSKVTDKSILRQLLQIEDKIVIGFYARMEPVKGHIPFLQSFKELVRQQDNVVCLMAGSGPMEQPIKAMASELGLDQHVRFLGFRNDIPSLLSITDVLVLPSQKEGIPRIVMEAMTLNVPVVATDVLGTRELVVDGITGGLVPYGDTQRMAYELRVMIENPEIRAKYGRAGRQRIEDEFDERQVVKRISTVYKELMQNNS